MSQDTGHGGGREVNCETLQGNYFKRNNAHLYVSSGLFVLFPVWHGKTSEYLCGGGHGLFAGSIYKN